MAPDRIPTNLRTLLILEVLGKSDHAMTATEINEQLGLPKQTVHRLCTTLEREGFLARQGNTNRFLPARRLRALGSGLLHTSQSHIARHQVLIDIAREVRETVNYVVPETTGMAYLDRVETDWPFRIQLPVGSNVPFHCTASGKTFMASMAPKARRAFVAGLDLQKLTAQTVAEPQSLLDELAVTAKRGYALDDEEFMDGMVAIAVPVLDTQGRYFASLAFHGPVQRMALDEAVTQLPVLQAGAERLRTALFD
ncbi:Transcriptional regulator, IclR family [Candidatus Rhodobacter oscarellae]|uniref:Transcriptional regulator, IclR family n=1 Tax=Candidatus Rhodobacter oscarellae TaxID=1675527 RepID=A0A0J9EBZ9_9RHOB|nr:IclR family transcriptional regulator [Candidatus Rhodobacter lobularis]KMW60305.1 Transcriptional regulator, IclR family [Candidatus Rhodobacter lobularis]